MKAALALTLAVGLAAFVFNSAAKGEEAPKWAVTLDLQVIAVSPDVGVRLTPQLQNEKTFEAAFQTLQRMMADDTAELLAWPVMQTVSGDYVAHESVVEIRYPAEFDIIWEPDFLGISHSFLPFPDTIQNLFHWGTRCPTAVGAENIGFSWDPNASVISAGKMLHIDFTPQWRQLLRYREWRCVKSPAGTEGVEMQPEFTFAKLTSSLNVPNGRRILAGTSLLQEPAPRLILFLLKASAARGDSASSDK